MKSHCWHPPVSGIKKLIPRQERIFLSLKPPVSEIHPKYLRVKGLVTKVWCNGVLLKKEENRYPIPPGVEKPWENEFFISGIPMAAWIEGNKDSGMADPGSICLESNLLGAAGKALVSFVVDQGVDKGDIFSFYDPVSSTYRMPGWRWDSGICLEALAKLFQHTGDETYKRAVELVVKRFLAVQISDQACRGGFPEIADLHMAPKGAPVLPQWVVPFNGAFIGHGGGGSRSKGPMP